MEYTTYFYGEFKLDKKLDTKLIDIINGEENEWGFCDWEYFENDNCIKWNGMEKFNDYKFYLACLVRGYLEPNYKLNGKVIYQDQELNDYGTSSDNATALSKRSSPTGSSLAMGTIKIINNKILIADNKFDIKLINIEKLTGNRISYSDNKNIISNDSDYIEYPWDYDYLNNPVCEQRYGN